MDMPMQEFIISHKKSIKKHDVMGYLSKYSKMSIMRKAEGSSGRFNSGYFRI